MSPSRRIQFPPMLIALVAFLVGFAPFFLSFFLAGADSEPSFLGGKLLFAFGLFVIMLVFGLADRFDLISRKSHLVQLFPEPDEPVERVPLSAAGGVVSEVTADAARAAKETLLEHLGLPPQNESEHPAGDQKDVPSSRWQIDTRVL